MAEANPLWGAPHIHGELLKLGIQMPERTVSNLMLRRQLDPPSQTQSALCELHPFRGQGHQRSYQTTDGMRHVSPGPTSLIQ